METNHHYSNVMLQLPTVHRSLSIVYYLLSIVPRPPPSSTLPPHGTPPAQIWTAPLTNVMVAKCIRTSPLPVGTRPEAVAPALALAAHPQAVQVLEPTGPRAAERRD